jgi:hypothetical protein
MFFPAPAVRINRVKVLIKTGFFQAENADCRIAPHVIGDEGGSGVERFPSPHFFVS